MFARQTGARAKPARPLRSASHSDALVIVSTVSLRNIRSYARLDLDLEPGLVLVVGPNGAGKTNLLESLHVGTQGFSPRTRADAQLVRFGEQVGRIALRGLRRGTKVELERIRQDESPQATAIWLRVIG